MLTDAILLSRYAETRAEDAFAELVRRHLNGVYSAALRLAAGDSHLAQDVTQQVFLVLAQKAGSLSRHPALIGWLYNTTRNKAINAIRAERRRRERETEAQAMSKPTSEPDWKQVAPVLDEVIAQLTEVDRTAVLLRFIDRRTFAEIGAALRMSEDGARRRIDRALDKLRVRLHRSGIVSSAAALGAAMTSHAASAAPAGLAASVVRSTLASVGAPVPAALILPLVSTKIAIGLAALAVLLGLGAATYEISASHRAEAAAAAAIRARNALSDRVLRLQEQARTESEPPPAAPTMAAEAAFDPLAAGTAYLQAHPEVAAAVVARSRARTLGRYGALFTSLALGPEQIRQFEDIIMQGEVLTPEGPGGRLQFQVGPTHASDDEISRQLLAMLGEANYVRYQDFVQAMPMHALAARLAGALYFTDSPLSPGQAAQLEAWYAGGTAVGLGEARLEDAILQNGATILTLPQRAVLAGLAKQGQLQIALARAAREQPTAGSNGAGR